MGRLFLRPSPAQRWRAKDRMPRAPPKTAHEGRGVTHNTTDPPDLIDLCTYEYDPLETAHNEVAEVTLINDSAIYAYPPGPSQCPLCSWASRIDPGCLTLSIVYTRCLRMRKIPKGWKESETILLHKGGPVGDISNWRPLAMGNCVAKLYAVALADRITVWAQREHQLSPEQKGFLTDEGCLEENFLLQSAIDDCRRSNKQLCVGWLDLSNAFGSVPHRHIFNTLERMGLPTGIINVIKDLYEGAGTRVRTINGHTDRIHLNNGVKQGCPLSPIVFNLAMEPLLRTIRAKRDKTSYKLVGGTK